jgi:hypothetical protein
MSKVNQLLHIDNFERKDGNLHVFAIYKGQDKDLVIPEEKYQFWLRTSGRLDGCMDYYDAAEVDRHGQLAYTITPEEYWDISFYEDICEDIATYIMRHDLITETMDVFGTLGQILKNQNNRTL